MGSRTSRRVPMYTPLANGVSWFVTPSRRKTSAEPILVRHNGDVLADRHDRTAERSPRKIDDAKLPGGSARARRDVEALGTEIDQIDFQQIRELDREHPVGIEELMSRATKLQHKNAKSWFA